jgi:hypothetical protein
MTADVAEMVRAEAPWADLQRASPLLDIRQAARAGYNASGRVLMSPATMGFLRENFNPADLYGRRSTSPVWAAASLAELFRNDDLPVPRVNHYIPEGQVVIVQDGLPALTLDVGG